MRKEGSLIAWIVSFMKVLPERDILLDHRIFSFYSISSHGFFCQSSWVLQNLFVGKFLISFRQPSFTRSSFHCFKVLISAPIRRHFFHSHTVFSIFYFPYFFSLISLNVHPFKLEKKSSKLSNYSTQLSQPPLSTK